MNCKKGGFVTMRHNELRDLTANMLTEVCKDVAIEPSLLEINGETFKLKSTKTGAESRPDISALGFWINGQRAFFDVRVCDPTVPSYVNSSVQQCLNRNEKEKKRNYNERIMNVDNGSFTPLVFSIHGAIGRECKTFYSRLATLISDKRKTLALLF